MIQTAFYLLYVYNFSCFGHRLYKFPHKEGISVVVVVVQEITIVDFFSDSVAHKKPSLAVTGQGLQFPALAALATLFNQTNHEYLILFGRINMMLWFRS